MSLFLVAVAAGVLLALGCGGSFHNVARLQLPKAPLFLIWASLALQAFAAPTGRAAGSRALEVALLLAGYGLVGVAALALWPRLRDAGRAATGGAALVIAGWAANAAVIAANGGMPVSRAALRTAGYGGNPDFSEGFLPKHVEFGGAHLTALADVVPVPGLAIAVSPGDLSLAVGLALLIVAALGGDSAERRWRPWSHASSLRS